MGWEISELNCKIFQCPLHVVSKKVGVGWYGWGGGLGGE